MGRSPAEERWKRYEAATRLVLPPRTHTILRVNGRAFHTYLRDADKPYDMVFMADMDKVMQALCAEVAGTVFAYAQSDEISLLVSDMGRESTEPWFGGVVQKMASISAALASVTLNQMRPTGVTALFDSRVFTVADAADVRDYFIWRQRDAVRNSISMAAQAFFTSAELHGVSGSEMQDMLWNRHQINWNGYPDGCKRGRVCVREDYAEDVTYEDGRTKETVTVSAQRTRWAVQEAPHFITDPDAWLAVAVDGTSGDR